MENTTTAEQIAAEDALLDQEARKLYENELSENLTQNHFKILAAGESAQNFHEFNQWDFLQMLVKEIQIGEELSDEDSNALAIAGVIADWMRDDWERTRAVRLASLKAKGGTQE